MSSNTGNVEEKAKEQETVEIPVKDKRRFTPDGEPIAETEGEDPQNAVEALSEVEQLEAKLKESEDKRVEAEKQVREFSERFRQAQIQLKAETDEQRARMQRTFDQKLESARGEIIGGLLDTLDNLKRAIAAAEKCEKRESDFEALLGGVRATAGLFESKMLGMGLVAVPSVGEEFNPEIHEAVEIVESPAELDNRVIDEFQTGYKFGDRLLRPARVRVGHAKS
jgi:molecular chaperone GrpE